VGDSDSGEGMSSETDKSALFYMSSSGIGNYIGKGRKQGRTFVDIPESNGAMDAQHADSVSKQSFLWGTEQEYQYNECVGDKVRRPREKDEQCAKWSVNGLLLLMGGRGRWRK
jgi:hypothetical protein